MHEFNVIVGHANLSRGFGGAHFERIEFFGALFPGMSSKERHGDSPIDNRQSLRSWDRATAPATHRQFLAAADANRWNEDYSFSGGAGGAEGGFNSPLAFERRRSHVAHSS
jgi:hypothetical protein